MGFITPDLPDVDPETWHTRSAADRMQVVTRHWVEHGFGTPSAIYLLYVFKMVAYAVGAAAVIGLTPGLGGLADIAAWWTQPIVYQKFIVFTLLFEVLGLGCGSGPLTARFWPPIGGFLYWLRPRTIRLPPWPNEIPFTRGDTRTLFDVALYTIVLASGVWALLSAGHGGSVTASGDVGLIDPLRLLPTIIALALLGLRDKTVFLAARGEHYWLKLLIFFFPFTDQIAAFKIVMLGLWWGAATSKLNHHFPYVVAAMTSNNALLRPKAFNWLKRSRTHRAGGPGVRRRQPSVAVGPDRLHGGLPPQHHFQPADGRSPGVEHFLHLLVVLPVRALQQHRDLRPELTVAAGDPLGRPRRDSGRGKHVPATDLIPARTSVLRGQLGVECLVLPHGRGGQDRGRRHQELRVDRHTDCPAVRHEYRRDHQRQSPRLPLHARSRSRAQRASASGLRK
jgi:hypothetical protein